MKKHLVVVAATAALTVSSLSLSLAAPATAAPQDIVSMDARTWTSDAQKMLDLINAHRKSKGLKPVRYSATVAQVAQGESDRLVRQEVINHTNNFLNDKRAGSWDAAGEIHAISWRHSVNDLVDWWKGSSAHNKVLTDPRMEVIGIGLTYVDGSLAGNKQGWRLVGTVTSYGYPDGRAPSDTRTTVPLGAPDVQVAAGPFQDVPASHPFAAEIAWMHERNISTGWASGNTRVYKPAQAVTRDQMAAFLYRMAGSPDFTPPRVSPFADVSTGQGFYKEMAWLHSKGISTGWVDGRTRLYKPGQAITRDQMAAFLYRLAGKPAFTPPPYSPFNDVSTRQGFYKEMAWLKARGISNGWDDGTYRPYAATDRDVMAAFLHRFAHTS
ncbi:CAP and S-layer homology domain-containing protein [Kocuria kalidii]|uniref:CAP and S-layer homology domain-containing protein n=1 Tax=Kocuria kalidii TaxID=3376283 RepID=UPI003798ED01